MSRPSVAITKAQKRVKLGVASDAETEQVRLFRKYHTGVFHFLRWDGGDVEVRYGPDKEPVSGRMFRGTYAEWYQVLAGRKRADQKTKAFGGVVRTGD